MGQEILVLSIYTLLVLESSEIMLQTTDYKVIL